MPNYPSANNVTAEAYYKECLNTLNNKLAALSTKAKDAKNTLLAQQRKLLLDIVAQAEKTRDDVVTFKWLIDDDPSNVIPNQDGTVTIFERNDSCNSGLRPAAYMNPDDKYRLYGNFLLGLAKMLAPSSNRDEQAQNITEFNQSAAQISKRMTPGFFSRLTAGIYTLMTLLGLAMGGLLMCLDPITGTAFTYSNLGASALSAGAGVGTIAGCIYAGVRYGKFACNFYASQTNKTTELVTQNENQAALQAATRVGFHI